MTINIPIEHVHSPQHLRCLVRGAFKNPDQPGSPLPPPSDFVMDVYTGSIYVNHDGSAQQRDQIASFVPLDVRDPETRNCVQLYDKKIVPNFPIASISVAGTDNDPESAAVENAIVKLQNIPIFGGSINNVLVLTADVWANDGVLLLVSYQITVLAPAVPTVDKALTNLAANVQEINRGRGPLSR